MDVDFMVDCVRCSAQNWVVCEMNKGYVELTCQSCNLSTKVGISDHKDYYDCHLCLSTRWDIADKTDNHVMFECFKCSSVIEFWLKSEKTN